MRELTVLRGVRGVNEERLELKNSPLRNNVGQRKLLRTGVE